MVYGPIAAFLVELFPARIRYTSMSLPYHVGNGVFGGLVPAAGASIAAVTGVALSGLLYPMAIAAIGVVVSLAFIREPTHRVRIWEEVGGDRRRWCRTSPDRRGSIHAERAGLARPVCIRPLSARYVSDCARQEACAGATGSGGFRRLAPALLRLR